ncbi:hypothetical protein BU16DRAFT_538352 [Lophium mytilinum]|uniref:Uncharacterized protein n=1 Tax=Lophium mytilinum TaxID=390894 RepID=A0A6A6QXS5_9PEZI|nr:hypothetical protein BU16DRAFT_538352 [Lophium mytilinum]
MARTKRVRSSSVSGPSHDEKKQKRSLEADEGTTFEDTTTSAKTLPFHEDLPTSTLAPTNSDMDHGQRAVSEETVPLKTNWWQEMPPNERGDEDKWDEGESISRDSGYDSNNDATSSSEPSFVPSKFAACDIIFVSISNVDNQANDGDDEAETETGTSTGLSQSVSSPPASPFDLSPKATSALHTSDHQPPSSAQVRRSVSAWLNQFSPPGTYHAAQTDDGLDDQTSSSASNNAGTNANFDSLSVSAQAHHAEGDVYAERSNMTMSDEEFFSEEEEAPANTVEAAMDYWYD